MFLSILAVGAGYLVFPGNAFFAYKKAYQKTMRGIDGKQVRAIFLGDSHAAIFDQGMLGPSIYNLSNGGDTTREMYLKMLYALGHAQGIEYVFLQADPHVLCAYRYTEENRSFIRELVDSGAYNLVYGAGQSQGLVQAAADRFPFLSGDLYVLARKKFLTKLTGPISQKKVEDLRYDQRSMEAQRHDAAHRAEDHFSSGKDEGLVSFYQKTIALCQSRGIHVIGIRYPVSREYLDAARQKGWATLAAEINAMGFERILDYSQIFQEKSSFENTDHLTRKAAGELLEKLRQDLSSANAQNLL